MDNEIINGCSLDVLYSVDKNYDNDRFIKLNLELMHDKDNRNNTYFLAKSLKDAKDSIKNSAVLARVKFDGNNDPQFGGHDMHIEEQKDGKKKVIYDEVPIGLVPESAKYEVYKTKDGSTRAKTTCYIWKGYSNYAEDIIQQKGTVKLSIEIIIDESKYDNGMKKYIVSKFRYRGITLLGDNYNPAMKGAKATLYEANVQETFEKMKELLDLELANFEKGGKEVMDKEDLQNSIVEKEVEKEEVQNDIEEKINNTFEQQEEEKVQEVVEDKKDEVEVLENNGNEDDIVDVFATYREKRKSLEEVVRKHFNSETQRAYLSDFDDKYVYVELNYRDGEEYCTKYVRSEYSCGDGVYAIDSKQEEMVLKYVTLEEAKALDEKQASLSYELEELREYKKSKLNEERLYSIKNVFCKFDEQLKGIEEYCTLKETSLDENGDITEQQVEEKCLIILGRQVAQQYTQNSKPSQKADVDFVFTDESDIEDDDNANTKSYERYLKQRYKK